MYNIVIRWLFGAYNINR